MPGVGGNRTSDPLITSPTPNQLSYFVPTKKEEVEEEVIIGGGGRRSNNRRGEVEEDED